MCLLALAIHPHPGCAWLLVSNRDELLSRPTQALNRWPDAPGPGIWAGRDLQDGGTWLGCSGNGRVAALTNVRQAAPVPAARTSRGLLVSEWLGGGWSLEGFCNHFDPSDFAGFNLLVCDGPTWYWFSNRDPQAPHQAPAPGQARWWQAALGNGLHAISNASLPNRWPKTRQLRDTLQQVLPSLPCDPAAPDRLGPQARQRLLRTLWSRQRSGGLGDGSTGMAPEAEWILSSPYTWWPDMGYATRSSCLLGRTSGLVRDQIWMEEWSLGDPPALGKGPDWAPPAPSVAMAFELQAAPQAQAQTRDAMSLR